MTGSQTKSLWELLWDYDPNGLVAVDRDLVVQVVNPAFCRMFRTTPDAIMGRPVSTVLEDAEDLLEAWDSPEAPPARETHYPAYDIYARRVAFAIRAHGLIACILVDLTHEWKERQEAQALKQETIAKVHEVVDRQMKVAQEIASLLGETTAETKVSLIRLIEMVERETP